MGDNKQGSESSPDTEFAGTLIDQQSLYTLERGSLPDSRRRVLLAFERTLSVPEALTLSQPAPLLIPVTLLS